MGSFRCKSKFLEHSLLNIILMDTNASSTDLITVQYDIISLGTNCARICVKKRDILVHRHGKWMMHSCETVLLLAPLKQRELSYPYETVLVLVQKIHLFCKLQTKCAKNIINQFLLVCCEQKQISCLTIHSSYQRVHLLICHEFGKGGFSCAVFCDCNVCKTLCAVAFCKFYKLVDLLTRHASLSLSVDTANASAVLKGTCKYGEATVLHNAAYIMKLHAKSHIRLVGAETVHSFLPGDSLDWKLHIDAKNFFEQIRKVSLVYIDYIININEGKLHIDLCELRLTVSTKVLVTEASCDLDVSVISGAHQKLFVQLR